MEDSPTIAAARRFLMLLQEGNPPSDRELARALDELAITYHEAPEGDLGEDDAERPTAEQPARPKAYDNWKKLYGELAARFPNYGYYATADPTQPVVEAAMVGDAIDDLADIVGDLEDVVWRSENIGSDDAHWHFKFHYQAHWGMHLRELSLYLHAKIWRASDWD